MDPRAVDKSRMAIGDVMRHARQKRANTVETSCAVLALGRDLAYTGDGTLLVDEGVANRRTPRYTPVPG